MNFSRHLAASVLALLLSYVVAACSSGSSGSVAGGRDSFIQQYCAEFMPCCSKAGKPADGAQCRAFVGALTQGATYDDATANKCLDEVRAQSSSATFCQTGASGPSCSKVFSDSTGVAKPGEACSEDEDCAPSSEGQVECASLFKDGATIRKCQIRVTGKAGDTPCVGTVDGNVTSYSSSGDTDIPMKGYLCYVKDGLRCDSTTKSCKVIAKIGEPCEGFGSNLCTDDAYCDTTKKLCVARAAVGQPCDGFSSDRCVDGAYCNTTTKVCVAAFADGAACKMSSECASRNCVNGACAKRSDFTTAFLCGG